jgi:glycosyltransferase involved in cell wall biosynthesis
MNNKAARPAPTVSVCVFAYNHERYLAEALDSVLSQKVDFPFEVIIAEDYSSDSTFQIARGYQERHPDLIRVEQSGRKEKLLINGHQTGRYNFFNALGACRGKYIAFLDGDDYWIDPGKLQRQVDYLEAHPDCSFVFHNVYLERGDRSARKQTYLPAGFADRRDVRQLLMQMNYVQTSSVLFRNNVPKEFPRIFHTCMFGDWPLHVFNLNFGYPEYMDEVMSVYRIGSGSWTRKRKIDQMKAILDFYDRVAEIAPKDVMASIPLALARNNRAIALEYLKKGSLLRFGMHALRAAWLAAGSLKSK